MSIQIQTIRCGCGATMSCPDEGKPVTYVCVCGTMVTQTPTMTFWQDKPLLPNPLVFSKIPIPEEFPQDLLEQITALQKDLEWPRITVLIDCTCGAEACGFNSHSYWCDKKS